MNNRFFVQKKNTYVSASDQFKAAMRGHDLVTIDKLLQEYKNNSAYLSLNSLVEQALKSGDYTTAGKLIAVGADTIIKEEYCRCDSDGYPETKTEYRSIFDGIMLYRNNLIDLLSGLLGVNYQVNNQSSSLDSEQDSLSIWSSRNKLQKALKAGNFITAGEIIAAGADTVFKEKIWVSDPNDCYPYGSYEDISRCVFQDIKMYSSDLKALAQGLGIDRPAENTITPGLK